eukprot:464400-Hanusia_phi.AAC.1
MESSPRRRMQRAAGWRRGPGKMAAWWVGMVPWQHFFAAELGFAVSLSPVASSSHSSIVDNKSRVLEKPISHGVA